MPQAVYAWQLRSPPQKQFEGLPAINFSQQVPADYFIVFGTYKVQVDLFSYSFLKSQGLDYQIIKVLDVYWEEPTRPEIMICTFQTYKNFDSRSQAVYVYRLVSAESKVAKAS